ncbi:MAG: hypothetical protein J5J06_07620 [Phycisphaerae bacterium]|nr:hypothetical protein [Phycisphaerae bacterium]
MRFFTGQFERTIDGKNRIQLPSQFRDTIDPEREGCPVYITPGEDKGTLSILPQRCFEELAGRIETEYMPGPESRRFERQFYSLASYVELDKQGRLVLPDRLRRMARLPDEIYLVGQKNRIDLWARDAFDRELGIDPDGADWPAWQDFLRMRPQNT